MHRSWFVRAEKWSGTVAILLVPRALSSLAKQQSSYLISPLPHVSLYYIPYTYIPCTIALDLIWVHQRLTCCLILQTNWILNNYVFFPANPSQQFSLWTTKLQLQSWSLQLWGRRRRRAQSLAAKSKRLTCRFWFCPTRGQRSEHQPCLTVQWWVQSCQHSPLHSVGRHTQKHRSQVIAKNWGVENPDMKRHQS